MKEFDLKIYAANPKVEDFVHHKPHSRSFLSQHEKQKTSTKSSEETFRLHNEDGTRIFVPTTKIRFPRWDAFGVRFFSSAGLLLASPHHPPVPRLVISLIFRIFPIFYPKRLKQSYVFSRSKTYLWYQVIYVCLFVCLFFMRNTIFPHLLALLSHFVFPMKVFLFCFVPLHTTSPTFQSLQREALR